MDVREASKIVEEIPDHEYIVFHYDIGGPVEERIVQLDGEFTAKQLFAIATVVNYPGLNAGAWEGSMFDQVKMFKDYGK